MKLATHPVLLASTIALFLWLIEVAGSGSALPGRVVQTKPVTAKTCQISRKMNQPMQQGIAGTVVRSQGNQMPPVSPDATPQPVSTEVWVFAGKIQGRSPQWSLAAAQNHPKRVTCVHSDAQGNFLIPLAPGEYTVFARYGSHLYLNSFRGDGSYQSVTVKPGGVVNVRLVNTENALF